MKRILSVFLAIVMVLSTVAFAAPVAVTVSDSAGESAAEGSLEGGELMAAVSIERGINMLTGTKDAFDGDTYSDTSWIVPNSSANTVVSVVDDPLGEHDKVLQFEYGAGKAANNWPTATFAFGADLDTVIGHPYVYIAFDYSKYVPDTDGYVATKTFYLQNSSSGYDIYAPIMIDMIENEGWKHYGKVHDLTVNYLGNEMETEKNFNSAINLNANLIFNMTIEKTNTVPVYVLWDNLMIVPAYKVTYYNKEGSQAVKEDYVIVDEEGNLLSSLAPESFLENGVVYGGWATSVGGSAVDSVALEDADIVLYATTEVDAFANASIELDTKLTKIGQKTNAVAVLGGNPEINPDDVVWSTEDTDIISISQNRDGSAMIKALSAGVATVKFTYGGYSFTDTITVATGYAQAEGADADVYEYAVFNVTSASAATLTVSYTTTLGSGTKTISVPAGVTDYSVYADFSNDANWGGTVVAVETSGVTVNSTKLYAFLEKTPVIEMTSETNLITTAGASIKVDIVSACDLDNVYNENFTVSVSADPAVATYMINDDNSVTVTAVAGKGLVTISASYDNCAEGKGASKDILVDVVTGNEIGYRWDFSKAASRSSFGNGWGHHAHSSYTDSSLKIVVTQALVNGVATNYTFTESGGKITLASNGGAVTTSAITANAVTSEHKYLVMTMRTNGDSNFAVTPYMTYEGNSSYITPSIQHTIGEEYATYVVDISDSFTGNEKYFKNMMFAVSSPTAVATNTVTDDTINSTFNNLTWQGGEMTYIEFSEIYFANYDPTKITYGVNLSADKTTLTGDETALLTPTVFANGEVPNGDVSYTVSDTSLVSVFKNSDGTATVTPLKDGTVTITATSVMDETATGSVTLTFTNIPTRTVAYDLKLMLIGNSYLEHSYLATADKELYNGWMSPGEQARGMASTAPDKDYFYRLCYYLQDGFDGSFGYRKHGGAVVEQAWKQGLPSGDPANITGWDQQKSESAMQAAFQTGIDYIKEEKPNLITIQLAQNAAHRFEATALSFYHKLFKMIDDVRPENSIVVVLSTMGSDIAHKVQKELVGQYGFYYADVTWIGDTYGWGASNPYLAFEDYPDYTNAETVEFRTHPGDDGMDEYAKAAYAIFEKYIPTTIPANLVTVPSSITLDGADTITKKGGTTELTVVADVDSAATDCYWSVDNEYIATVDENGVVTALLNGTVKVTATSVYDDRVVATKTITISGQTPHYTLTYAKGTTSEVANLPEAFAYASGEYVFPQFAAVPERNGYKFAGWSLTEGGDAVESVNMTGNKTVYAVWKYADNWQFNNDGDLEGISFAGFNVAVANGVGTMISYNNVAVGVSDESLLLSSDFYKTFKAKLSMSTVESGDKLTLTIFYGNGLKMTFSQDALAGENVYTYDISTVPSGTITGFSLFTSNSSDGLGMTIDYMEFVKTEIEGDVTYNTLNITTDTVLDAGDNKITIESLTVADGVTFHLGSGTFVINSLSGNGAVLASPNANVLGDAEIPGKVKITLNALATGAKRYAEVDGNQYFVSDSGTVYGVIPSKNLLVQIVDVAADGAETSRYFYVKADGTYEEMPMGNYMYNSASNNGVRMGEADDEVANEFGIRLAATVSVASKYDATAYTITETGYIIGLEETLIENGEQLNFNATKYASGIAFKQRKFDKVFDQSVEGVHVFTGILVGCDPENYEKRLVAKTYTKLTIGGDEFVVYGEPMVESYFSIAQGLDYDSLSSELKAVVDGIKDSAFDDESGMDGDLLEE